MPELTMVALAEDFQLYNSDAAYTTAQSETALAGNPNENQTVLEVGQSWAGGTTLYWVRRDAIRFSSTAIPSNAVIISGTLQLYGQATGTAVANSCVLVNGSALPWPLPYDGTEFGAILSVTTSCGAISATAVSTTSYNSINLTTAGLSAITKAGTTEFGLRSSEDIAAISPPANSVGYTQWIARNTADSAKWAKLTVTYQIGTQTAPLWVEATELHYFDANGVEREVTGAIT